MKFIVIILFAFLSTFNAKADVGGVPLHGFADVGYGLQTQGAAPRENVSGFVMGSIDLYLTPDFGDNVRTLMEIVLEPTIDSQSYGIDAERLQIGYVFSENLTAWVGRFHSPYGYWTTAYHHGAQIQPSIYKPKFLDWEDGTGVMPAHTVGVWLTGKAQAGDGKIKYDLYAGNGSRITEANIDFNNLHDDNHSPAVGATLSYFFGGKLDGLRLGVDGLSEEVDAYDIQAPVNTLLARSMMRFLGGYAALEGESLEFNTEFYRFFDTNPALGDSPTYGSWAGEAHFGWNINSDWTPYFRVERARFNQQDSFFNQQYNGYSYDRTLVGVRYNLNSRSSLKLEANRTWIRDNLSYLEPTTTNTNVSISQGAYNEVRAQYAVSF